MAHPDMVTPGQGETRAVPHRRGTMLAARVSYLHNGRRIALGSAVRLVAHSRAAHLTTRHVVIRTQGAIGPRRCDALGTAGMVGK